MYKIISYKSSLKKLNTPIPKKEKKKMAPKQVRPNFDALRDLHDSANDLLLHSPVIKKSIANHHGQQKWVHEISEASLKILESCGNTKDVLSLVKDHLQDLQSTFRRVVAGAAAGTANNNNNSTFAGFSIQRKKLKKAVLKRLESLKGMKNKKNKNKCNIIFTTSDDGDDVMSINQELNVVVNVLREVRMTTMAIVESLVSLMSIPISPNNNNNNNNYEEGSNSKPNKLLLLLRLFESNKSRNQINRLYECDATKRLEEVETAIEDLEEELECIFRRLIRTRVSLLNILTN